MKTDMLLSDFIAKVKEELVTSQCKPEEAFYELTDVELEVSFALATTGKAKGKLVVVEFGGGATASETHQVRLKFKPVGNKYKKQSEIINAKEEKIPVNVINYEVGKGFVNNSQSIMTDAIGTDSNVSKKEPEKEHGPLYVKKKPPFN